MTYQPDGPAGLRMLADFFEQILSKDPTYAHMFTEEGTVEEDMRRWADEMTTIQAFFPEWEIFAPVARLYIDTFSDEDKMTWAEALRYTEVRDTLEALDAEGCA